MAKSFLTPITLPAGSTAPTPSASDNSTKLATTAYVDGALSGYVTTASYTAADVLAKLLTVDGASSGIDADLLDGQHGSYYLNAGNLNAGTLPDARLSSNVPLKNAANTFTANQTISNATEARLDLACSGGRSVRFVSNFTPNVGIYDYGASKWLLRIGSDDLTTLGGGLTVNGSPTFNASATFLNASSGIVDLYWQVAATSQAGIFADNTPRLVFHVNDGGTIRFRPKGRGSTSKECYIDTDGFVYDGSARRLGYREAALIDMSGNVTLDDTHSGKTFYNNNGASYTITIPTGLNAGMMFQVITYGGGSNVVFSRSSTNLYWIDGSGTNKNANRTLGIYGWATLWTVDGTNWFITGQMLT